MAVERIDRKAYPSFGECIYCGASRDNAQAVSPGAPCRATMARRAEARAALVAEADLRLAEAAIPCRSGHAGIARDDLSQSLYSDTRCAEKAAEGTPAHGAADAPSQGWHDEERTGTDNRHSADISRQALACRLSARSGRASEHDQRSSAPAEATALIAAQRKAVDHKGGPRGCFCMFGSMWSHGCALEMKTSIAGR